MDNLYTAAIYQAVSEGFQSFTDLVSRNSELCRGPVPVSVDHNHDSGETEKDIFDYIGIITKDLFDNFGEFRKDVFDDFESKIEAWRTACHVACQIIIVDMEVTTGLEKNNRSTVL